MISLDIKYPAGEPIESEGTAFYRLPKEVKDFLLKCQEGHGIIGFDYDPESPWNFGVILNKKK